jgi:hypothetical protein
MEIFLLSGAGPERREQELFSPFIHGGGFVSATGITACSQPPPGFIDGPGHGA